MNCSVCRTPYESLDNYCRHCGASVVVEVPVVRESEAMPVVPWVQVRPAVTKSAMALVAGVALEIALRRMGRAVVGAPRMTPVRRDAPKAVAKAPAAHQITETLFVRKVTRIE